MIRRTLTGLIVAWSLLCAGITLAAETLTLGVFAYRPKPLIEARFEPLAQYLSAELESVQVRLLALDQTEMEEALERNRLDLILTNPSHYQVVRSHNSLSGALATLVSLEDGQETASLGGVIITAADRADITELSHLKGRRIAVPGTKFLGGYQTQAFELHQVGIRLPGDAQLQEVGGHDAVIAAVLGGQADAGFVRTGVIESLAAEGKLTPSRLGIVNRQSLSGFPYILSTRLYPEWPFVTLPHVRPEVVRRLAAALLALEKEHPAARAAGIAGFDPPADYLPVERLARALRVPPFDQAPEVTWQDVWTQHRLGVIGILTCLAVIAVLLVQLLHRNRQLSRTAKALSEAMAMRNAILTTIPDLVWLKDVEGVYMACNPKFEQFFGAKEADIIGRTDYDFVSAELADFFRWHDKAALAAGRPTINEERIRFAADGREVLLETAKTPLRTDDGRVIGVLGIGRDITERKRAEEALGKERLRLRNILEGTRAGTWEWNVRSGEILVNERWAEMLGYRLGEISPLTRETWRRMVHPDDRTAAEDLLGRHLGGALDYFECETRMRHRDGGWVWILDRGKLVSRAADGEPRWVAGTHQDITDRKLSEEKLNLAASVFTFAREGIVISDADGRIIEVNDAFARISGHCRADVVGHNLHILSSAFEGADFDADMWGALTADGYWSGEVRNRRPTSERSAESLTISAVRGAGGATRHYVALFSDITPQKNYQKQLERIAHYDPLTALPNRSLLADRLTQAMAQARRRGQRLALVYLDLDGFKAVNDAHGHAIGDLLLADVAGRMKRALREGDTVARLGGDEFVALLADLSVWDGSEELLLMRLLSSIALPLKTEGLSLKVSASIGVTYYPQALQVDSDELLHQADQAMYQAKLAGGNCFRVFDGTPAQQAAGDRA